MVPVLYLAERGSPTFETERTSVDVVCVGDMITGWNNFGDVLHWPSRNDPEFLQRLCDPLGLAVANAGIAGEVSGEGLGQIRDYLGLFPHARYFVIGYGTNDLRKRPDIEPTDERIIGNLDGMVRAIRDGGRQPFLLNVPHAIESMISRPLTRVLRRIRDHHNERLAAYCRENRIPLVDVASKLRDEHFDYELQPRAPFTWMARRLNEDLGEEVSDDTLFSRSPTADHRYGPAR